MILVAEDDHLTRELIVTVLQRDGYRTFEVDNGTTAIEHIRSRPFDLILADVQMSRSSGMEVLQEAVSIQPETPVVLITAFAAPGAAMDAMAHGAADYLAKPIDVKALSASVSKALQRRRVRQSRSDPTSETAPENVLSGISPVMLDMYKQIGQLAPTDATVLVMGESGSGKELVARTIHLRSRRAQGPYVTVNCAAFAEGLLESELFGHERGAFTGAHATRRGVFEVADGGTLFLDEIGEVPAKMQAQLLRVLQEGEVRRVGSSVPIKVNVRVIAATNRDLAAEVARKNMRADLYYRLNVLVLRVPPLRTRGEDVITLARHFVTRHAMRFGRPVPELSDEAIVNIRAYAWPGNVRELENALARAVAVSQNGVLLPCDLPSVVTGNVTPQDDGALDADWPTFEELQRRYLRRVLERTGGNKTAAAALAGIDRRTLQRLIIRGRPPQGE